MSKAWLVVAVLLIFAFATPVLSQVQLLNGGFELGQPGKTFSDKRLPIPAEWGTWGNWSSYHINPDTCSPPYPLPDGGEFEAGVHGGSGSNRVGGFWQVVPITSAIPAGFSIELSGYFTARQESTLYIPAAQFWLIDGLPDLDANGDLITTNAVAALDYTGERVAQWTYFRGGGLVPTGTEITVISRFKADGNYGPWAMHMDALELHVVPEPGSMVALMMGVAGLGGVLIRRR